MRYVFACIIIPTYYTVFSIKNSHRQATGFTLAVAVTQLLIYNGLGGTHGGPGEKIAHYFEFTFAAWKDTKFLGKAIGQWWFLW